MADSIASGTAGILRRGDTVRICRRTLLACALTACVLAGSGVQAAGVAVVAAASSLRQVWPALLGDFGSEVQTSFAASGTLAQQILHGAPYELFLSADTDTVDWLLAQDAGRFAVEGAAPVVYAEGVLVLIVRDAGDGQGADGIDDAPERLQSGTIARLALANPRHAPYGRAAMRWLDEHGITGPDAPLQVIGENAAQAVQYVLAGAADAALVPRSLAQAESVRSRISVIPLADAERFPVRHAMLLLPAAGSEARAFHDYLQTDAAQAIFTAYGFLARR